MRDATPPWRSEVSAMRWPCCRPWRGAFWASYPNQSAFTAPQVESSQGWSIPRDHRTLTYNIDCVVTWRTGRQELRQPTVELLAIRLYIVNPLSTNKLITLSYSRTLIKCVVYSLQVLRNWLVGIRILFIFGNCLKCAPTKALLRRHT